MGLFLQKIRVKFLIIHLCIRWMFRVNLGDKVIYKGQEYVVANGVRSNSWRLHGLNNGVSGWVSRDDCCKVKTLPNYINSFKSGYRFYVGYWYDIWVRVGVKQWMKDCRIW